MMTNTPHNHEQATSPLTPEQRFIIEGQRIAVYNRVVRTQAVARANFPGIIHEQTALVAQAQPALAEVPAFFADMNVVNQIQQQETMVLSEQQRMIANAEREIMAIHEYPLSA